jgi:mono/diheme cytochrome c family protein
MKTHLVLLALAPLVIGSILGSSLCAAPRPGTSIQASSSEPSRGDVLFAEKGCVYCHGVNGVGIPNKAPSLLTVGKRLTKGAIARQIHDGGKGMPAFGEALQPDEITALVEMLAKKKKVPKGVQQSDGKTS